MNQKTTCPSCKTLFEVSGEEFNAVVSCPTCNGNFNPVKEYVKASLELTKTPEFQASLEASIDEAKKNITHAEFVTGMQNGTMGFKCLLGEPCQLLRGSRLAIFNILVFLYSIAPFILIPLWAYHEQNWWLLIGIVISRLSTRAASGFLGGYGAISSWSGKRDLAGGFLLLVSVALWFVDGIHSYPTFFSLSALWGFIVFHMAEEIQNQYAVQSLIESPELFYSAVEHHKIKITNVGEEEKKRREIENI